MNNFVELPGKIIRITSIDAVATYDSKGVYKLIVFVGKLEFSATYSTEKEREEVLSKLKQQLG